MKQIEKKVKIKDLVKAWRKSKGLTQEVMAHHCGVVRETYAHWEIGTSRPSKEVLEIIINKLIQDTREEAYKKGIKAVKIPEYDHRECPLPQTCIGYQNAESEMENTKEILLDKLSKKK